MTWIPLKQVPAILGCPGPPPSQMTLSFFATQSRPQAGYPYLTQLLFQIIWTCLFTGKRKWKSLGRFWVFAIPWTLQSMEFSRPGYLLEWVAFPFSRGSSQPRDQTQDSHIVGRFLTSWATREAQYGKAKFVQSCQTLCDPWTLLNLPLKTPP